MSWHIEDCTGACLACLIEETVRQHYGTQGLDFLRRKVGAGGTVKDLSKCPQCGGEADNGHDRCHPPTAYLCSKCSELHNDRVEGRDAASSRRVPSHDGLCGNGDEGKEHEL